MATPAKIHPQVDRTALAKEIGKDRGYVTKLLNGTREAPLEAALAIYRRTGVKLGTLQGKDETEIANIERAQSVITEARSAAE